ncbi:MAG: hypothetical protein IJJ82_06300 [Clostridia bacterium]|nr:hypothetical protein [Clostridia bacterium]
MRQVKKTNIKVEDKKGNKKQMNIIERHKNVEKISNINRGKVFELTCRDVNNISTRDFLNIIARTNELNRKGDKLTDLLVTYGNMNVMFENNSNDFCVDFAVIPIFKDKGIRFIVEYQRILETCCQAIVSPYLKDDFIKNNFKKLDDIFSDIFTKIYQEKINLTYDVELRKFLRRTGKKEISNYKEALEYAKRLKKAIIYQFGENFTEGLFKMIKFECCEKIEDLFFNYIVFMNEGREKWKK